MELTAVPTPAEEGGYVAPNPETWITTQGKTSEEAVANLQDASVHTRRNFRWFRLDMPS